MLTKNRATIQDLYNVPDNGKAEIVNGELVLMNPTAGVDVSAKDSIYATIDDLKRAGQSVLLATSDDGDLEICDRILVMFDGEVVAEMHPPFSETALAAAVQGPGTAAPPAASATPHSAHKETQS